MISRKEARGLGCYSNDCRQCSAVHQWRPSVPLQRATGTSNVNVHGAFQAVDLLHVGMFPWECISRTHAACPPLRQPCMPAPGGQVHGAWWPGAQRLWLRSEVHNQRCK